MEPLRVIVLMSALVAGLVTCGDRFEGRPLFSDSSGGTAGGEDGGGSGGSAGSNATGGNSGSAGTSAGGNTGASAGSAGLGGEGGEGGEGGVGGEAPLTPVAEDSLVLWLRAGHGVEHESGMVYRWINQSFDGADATQTAENVMPKFDPGALDGKPALVFDQDDFLRLPEGLSDFSQGLTAFAVAQFDQDACAGVFHLGNGGETDDIELGRYQGGLLYEVAEPFDHSSPVALGEPQLLTAVHRPSLAVELRVNQSLGAEPDMALPAVVSRAQNYVGRSDYADCGSLQGKLSELLIYSRAVTDEELLAIEGYLQREWSCCE